MIGAQDAIAFSPQFSIERRVVPFETLWAPEAARIRFLPELDQAPRLKGTAYLFFDPQWGSDQRHAEMYAATYPVCLVPIPGSGHPAISFLSDTGHLESIIFDILSDRFDAATYLPKQ
jgi:hypothetical protein